MFKAAVTFQRYQFTLDVDLHLEKGSITALIGASGSGKSSLFRVLSGLEQPSSGQIYSDGVCWFDADKKTNLAVQKRKVGMVFQDYALFEHLTVYENIAYGVEKSKQVDAINQWLSRIKLSHKADMYPQALSGGEKQRVALARVLVAEPDILLLDEPFSALDSAIRHDLRRELQTLISDAQIPVLIATHDLLEARFLADTLYVLADGKIIQHGPVASTFKKPQTVQAAKVLGWQNILMVSSFDSTHIEGEWGKLAYQCPHDAVTTILAVAVPLDAFTIALSEEPDLQPVEIKNSLTAVVTHYADMGDYSLIEAKLNDGSHIVLKSSAESRVFSGKILTIFINLSLLIPLSGH